MECAELFIKTATGIGIIKEFHYPQASRDDDLEANTTKHESEKTVQIIPLFFFLLDILDVILDIIFSSQLFIMGQHGFGALMLVMTVISVCIWIRTRTLIQHALEKSFHTSTIRIVMSFSEMAMFFIQDATTIFIFGRVPESYGNGNVLSVINLVTTMVCGASLVFVQVCLVCNKQGCGRCRDFFLQIFHFFCFCCNLFLLLFVLMLAISVGSEDFGVDDEGRNAFFAVTCTVWLFAVVMNFVGLPVNNEDLGEDYLSNMGLENIFCACCN
mmetsp:Transcript_3148/g.3639  ORF Transcript_3148/g.3639 Transcript_3148/m.3639 type:complete len:271 (+) Transcript_3148:157-969(+)